MGVGPDLALAGTCRHQITAISSNQYSLLISVWQRLAPAGIRKQVLPFLNGSIHGIAVFDISAVLQYHGMREFSRHSNIVAMAFGLELAAACSIAVRFNLSSLQGWRDGSKCR